jgi:hypothetical protein
MPEIGEEYTVKAYTSNTGSSRTSLTWYANGSVLESFSNSDTITLTAGETPTKLTARAAFANGVQVEASRTISPVRIDLTVNADTLTPAFYLGRSLPSNGSNFTATALVFKNNTQLTSLSYVWKINDKTQGSGAVRGKDSISFTPSFESEVTVSVDVFDAQNIKIGSDTISVPVVAPELYFYENNPLHGLSPVALRDPHIFVGDEMNIRAEAYYLNANTDPATMHTEWQINGSEVTSASSDPQEIAIRKEGNRGTSQLSFHIRDLSELLHGVRKSLSIKF